ncbi:hypothetical protein JCM4814A_15840 [Streptomyces phaeofaciens JCM 4814]|uniref:Uncharacterized protein n=1 Tax=Streptomyces phaeofaciens TaxID=68254 RepID=A0A918H9S4_9ACTN|nr:hypothetical protein [Streptomyces phaeofaciens]GGT48210.1 hypothetical protein GCM10010226_26620 [Streptomyces phaeofaciens]
MSDELSAALRELAADRETAPTVAGPAIRARAMRRRRRRRAAAALGAGTTALALLGFALTLSFGEDPDHPDRSAGRGTSAVTPPGSVPPSTATPAPVSGALDLPGSDLTFGGRVMPILSTFDLTPGTTGTTSMTVVAKPVRMALAVDVVSEGRTVVNVAHAVELDGEGGPLYVGTFPPDIEARGDYGVRGGVIALGAEDARWFHARISLGDSISVTLGPVPTATPSGAVTAPAVTAPGAAAYPTDSAQALGPD